MRTPGTPGAGITGAQTAITLGSRITGFLPRTGLHAQRAIVVVWLATRAAELREAAA